MPPPETDAQGTEWAPLATYEDGRIAAVCCCFGQGRAVLCGSHPELLPDWLTPTTQPGVLMSLGMDADDAAGLASHALGVQEALSAGRAQRWMFWLSLLQAAGLGKYLRDGS